MADLKLIGAVAIKVRPDTSKFREETQKGIDEQLGPNGDRVSPKVKVNVNADTTEASVKVTKFEDEVNGKTLTLNVGLDHDSVEKAKAQIDQALRTLDNAVIKTTLDRPSLEEAKRKIDELGKNAQVEFKFVQDQAGYQAVLDKIRDLRNQRDLATEWKFDVDETSLQATEEKAKRALERIESQKTVSIDFNNNYDSLNRAIEEVNKKLDDAKKISIETRLNATSLEATRAELRALQKNASVEFKFVRDEEGYQSILDKIKSIREQKGLTSTWDFKTDAASLAEAERKAKEGLQRVKDNAKIEIKYTNSFDGINKALADIDQKIAEAKFVTLKTKLDSKSLEDARAELLSQLNDAEVTVKINEDKTGYETVLARIKEIRAMKAEVPLTFNTDEASLARVEYDMRVKLSALKDLSRIPMEIELDRYSLDKAEKDAKDLKDKINDMKASIEINDKGTLAVSAQLNYIGRNRVVEYFANVNGRSVAVAEGTLKSLGGLNVLHEATGILESMFTKFDEIALKVGGLSTAVGSLADVALYATSAIFKVGDGVLQSIGLIAAAPALMAAFASSVFVYTAAFDNFKNAFSTNAKTAAQAMSQLPPIARETVDSIRGLYKEVQKPVQEAFWDKMGPSLKDAIVNLIPKLKDGLVGLAPSIGAFTAGMLNSFDKMAKNTQLDQMFSNLKGFFDNLGKASEPFFDAFNKFGLAGSAILPQFGQWLADMATRFDNYATKVSANGQINDWIGHGVHSLQEMWAVGGDVADIFRAITSAASLAGTGGLSEFEAHLRKIADTMQGEPWQSKAKIIFEGAREGASAFNTGLQNLIGTFGNAAVEYGAMLKTLGGIGGAVLTDLSDIFGVPKFQQGVSNAFQGMLNMMTTLRPAAKAIGDIIGNLGNIASSAFSNMGGILNQMFTLVDGALAKIADNLAAISPRLMNTVGGLFAAATPFIMAAATALNSVLDLMALVPNTFSVAGVAIAGFFALRALASKFFESFSGTKYFTDLKDQWTTQQVEAGKTVKTFQEVDGTLKKMTLPTEKFSPTRAVFQDLTSQVGQTKQSFIDMYGIARQGPEGLSPLHAALATTTEMAKGTAKTIGGGLLGALGGPWGLAIAGASVAIGIFAQSQADASAHVQALTQDLDKQTGSFNQKGLQDIAASWSDIGKASDGMANLFRGSKAANETASALKLNLGDVTKIIANGGPKSDDLVRNLTDLGTAMDNLHNTDAGASIDELKTRADDAAKAFGLTADELDRMGISGADIDHLATNLHDEAVKAALAKQVMADLGKATGTSSVEAGQMSAAMKTIGDESQTAASKIGAINTALELLKGGGKMSVEDAKAAANGAQQNALQQAEAMHDELVANQHLFDQTTGMIDTTSASGLKLRTTMKEAADGIKIHAQAVYDAALAAHKTPEQAASEAAQIVSDGNGELDGIAQKAGISVDALKTTWESFFGSKWQLTAVFSATADQFQAVRKTVEDSGIKWDESIFQAYFDANPDPANRSVDKATEFAKKWANDTYKAELTAINPDALQAVLEATGQADNYKNGDYTAVMQAWNSTDPGVQAAIGNIKGKLTGPQWAAAVQVLEHAIQNSAKVQGAINGITGKTVSIFAQVDPQSVINSKSTIAHIFDGMGNFGGGSVGGFDGAFLKSVTDAGSLLSGAFPMKKFANGGIENHVAQISYPSANTPIRIWAEEETLGEAYIPLSAAKRTRSTEILTQVANEFGYTLTKQFANGGSTVGMGGNPQAASRPSLQIQIDQFNQHTSDTISDVGRGIMREARKAGVFATEAF